MHISFRTVIVAALPLFCGAWPTPAFAQTSRDREVVSLSFRGNRAFSASELTGAIATERTRCKSLLFKILPFCPLTNWGFAQNRAFLDEAELPSDLLRLRVFYRQRGFRSVEVDTAVTRMDGKVKVVFLIREGEPVRVDSLEIEGVGEIVDESQLDRGFPLRPGDPFDRIRLDRGKELILDRLQDRGYITGVVLEDTYLPPDEGARVMLEVQPGPRVRIGQIRIQGADAINRRVVRKLLSFEEGEYFDQGKILESQRNLYALEALRFANISRGARLSAQDTSVDVIVQVTEAPTRTIRAGVGMSTTECGQTEVRFTHRNFLGGARRLELSARLSNVLANQFNQSFPCTDVGRAEVFQDLDFRIRAELDEPYFFSTRNSFRVAVFEERETFPDIFVRLSTGAELALIRRVTYRLPLTLAYRIEFTGFAQESADIFFCINFGFCQPQDIDVLIERRLLSPLALSLRYDRTDVPFSPTRGYYINAQFERADRLTGSAYQYIRFAVEAADFEEIAPGLVGAARFRTGLVEPTGGLAFSRDPDRADRIVHPRKRFFAGGPQSVRGFGQNLLGPRVLVVDAERQCPATPLPDCVRQLAREDPRALDERPVGGNAAYEASFELRKQLGGPWGMVAFLDFGQVGNSLRKIKGPILTPGAGVRYRSPVGPLRLDIGYNPSRAIMLPVVAELPGGEIKELDTRVRFDPFTFDDPSLFREVFRRLQLQLSIGEAF